MGKKVDDPRKHPARGGRGMKCLECGWVGGSDETVVGRDGDSYDASTEFWDICPICGAVEFKHESNPCGGSEG